MLEPGPAVTLVPVLLLSPVFGDQSKVAAPAAVRINVWPWQTADAGDTNNVGMGLTVTVVTILFPQPPLIPVIVYVVVADGLAVIIVPVLALNAIFGDQLKSVAPETVKVADCPLQITAAEDIDKVGLAFTFKLVIMALLQLSIVPITV